MRLLVQHRSRPQNHVNSMRLSAQHRSRPATESCSIHKQHNTETSYRIPVTPTKSHLPANTNSKFFLRTVRGMSVNAKRDKLSWQLYWTERPQLPVQKVEISRDGRSACISRVVMLNKNTLWINRMPRVDPRESREWQRGRRWQLLCGDFDQSVCTELCSTPIERS